VEDVTIIVALGILPEYQGSGIGKSLVGKVEDEAKRLRKKKLLVSTSNDDLPALAFYQSLGFQIYEVKPNVIAEKHGKILKGVGRLPVRDELRLQKTLHEPKTSPNYHLQTTPYSHLIASNVSLAFAY